MVLPVENFIGSEADDVITEPMEPSSNRKDIGEIGIVYTRFFVTKPLSIKQWEELESTSAKKLYVSDVRGTVSELEEESTAALSVTSG